MQLDFDREEIARKALYCCHSTRCPATTIPFRVRHLPPRQPTHVWSYDVTETQPGRCCRQPARHHFDNVVYTHSILSLKRSQAAKAALLLYHKPISMNLSFRQVDKDDPCEIAGWLNCNHTEAKIELIKYFLPKKKNTKPFVVRQIRVW